MLNYDPKKDKINPKRCQICVQRLEEKNSDVIFPNLGAPKIYHESHNGITFWPGIEPKEGY